MIRKLIQSTLKQFGYRLIRDGYASQHGVPSPEYGLEPFFFLLKRYGFFGVNILTSDQIDIAERFAGKDGLKGAERFAGAEWTARPRPEDSVS